ncbi:MAG: phosphoribosyltransferase [Thermoprotei archaeon]|nr:MAG: phosphoribosyltransferase [Thermoprotei archaeon]
MEFLAPTWERIHVESLQLSSKILQSGYYPDVVIGVLRGGYIIARLVTDVIQVEDLGVVEVKFYKGIGERAERPIITQPLTTDVRGKKVLIIDDVVDSGRTLQVVSEQVRLRGAKDVKSAALYYKPKSIIKPDYFIVETEAWVFFPWEIGEFIREMGLEPSSKKVSAFLQEKGISFSSEIIEWVTNTLKIRDSLNK